MQRTLGKRVTLKPGVVAGQEAMGKVCGVPMAMLPGQSWTPPPTTGWRTNVESLPAPPFTVGQPGRRQAGPAVGPKAQGGEGAPMV